MYFISLTAFKILSLLLIFNNLIVMCISCGVEFIYMCADYLVWSYCYPGESYKEETVLNQYLLLKDTAQGNFMERKPLE